ncbi:MAG TPA: hypothetical protein PK095_09855 [Myxococcota bacterium]|nr:hypothetical protein [Myxococcota bacterium]
MHGNSWLDGDATGLNGSRRTSASELTQRVSRLFGAGAVALFSLGALGCSGEFHSDRGLDDMVCDSGGCFVCDDGRCEEYRCDATHQCPMQRTCSIDNRCLPGDGDPTDTTDPLCTSHDDCAEGQICTLDGRCVTSPGGGPGDVQDTSDTSDTSDDTGDTSDGTGDVADDSDVGPDSEVTLPQHPDDVCLSNADCGLDGTCVNGGCYFACDAGKCPPGQGCFDGQCRALEVPENMCTFNGECGTSHACIEGTCYTQCAETLDCPAHTRCSGSLCIGDTRPVLQCSGPGSCASGSGCVDGKCLATCTDSTCDAGFECKVGFCHKVVSCFDRDDCGGADCVDGTCTEL